MLRQAERERETNREKERQRQRKEETKRETETREGKMKREVKKQNTSVCILNAFERKRLILKREKKNMNGKKDKDRIIK